MIEISKAKNNSFSAKRIDDLLSEHAAEKQGHPFESVELVFDAYEGTEFLGGISAKMGREWVFVELLAVTAKARGRGLGRALLEKVEATAIDAEKSGIWLDTYSFQAPGFYEKLGYKRCGCIPNCPNGHERLFFAKRLDGEPF